MIQTPEMLDRYERHVAPAALLEDHPHASLAVLDDADTLCPTSSRTSCVLSSPSGWRGSGARAETW